MTYPSIPVTAGATAPTGDGRTGTIPQDAGPPGTALPGNDAAGDMSGAIAVAPAFANAALTATLNPDAADANTVAAGAKTTTADAETATAAADKAVATNKAAVADADTAAAVIANTADASPATLPKPYLTIRPSSGWSAVNLRELWQFRDLLMSLAGRDVKLRYKQTALGVIWVVLQPLMAAGIFSFVFGKLADFPSEGVPYFLFSYAGLLGWNLFSGTLTKTSGSLVGNSGLISKVFFPRLVLPLSVVPSVLVDFGVAFAMMAVMMAVRHVVPGPAIVLLPVWVVLLLSLSMGIGLCTAALAVSYRDVSYILPVLTQILLYASPVAYSVNFALTRLSPAWRPYYLLNPLAAPLEAFRWSLLGTTPPPMWATFYSAIVSIAFFGVGALSFKRMERKFADVI